MRKVRLGDGLSQQRGIYRIFLVPRAVIPSRSRSIRIQSEVAGIVDIEIFVGIYHFTAVFISIFVVVVQAFRQVQRILGIRRHKGIVFRFRVKAGIGGIGVWQQPVESFFIADAATAIILILLPILMFPYYYV